jgi:hypothetical protein
MSGSLWESQEVDQQLSRVLGERAVDNGVERHAWAFLHGEIPDIVHPFSGLDDSVDEGCMI